MLKFAAATFIAAAFLFTPLRADRTLGAEDTPQALGEKMITAMKAKDKDALILLIHPGFVTHMKKNDPATLDQILNDWANTRVPETYEFQVRSIDEVKDYDKATQTLVTGGQTMYFPEPPTDLLILMGDVEIKEKVDGEEKTAAARVPLIVNAVTNDGGKWYFVLPVIKGGE